MFYLPSGVPAGPVKSFGHTLSSLLVSAGLWGCGVNGLGWYVNFRCFLFTLANFPEVLSEKNNIAQTYKDHILKHASMLRNPLYDLVRAADYLEQWVNGLLPPGQLLDVSAFPVCIKLNMPLSSFKT